jgi:co-chaperonin GroES (HSP10)
MKMKTDKEAKENYANKDIPQVKGWHILVKKQKQQEKVGGVFLPETFQDDMKYLTNVGQVLALGACCYNDKEKYGKEPWCKVGDYVVWGKHQGIMVMFKGEEYTLLLDDAIICTIDDPSSIDVAENIIKRST